MNSRKSKRMIVVKIFVFYKVVVEIRLARPWQIHLVDLNY